jgi:hypothetical protein
VFDALGALVHSALRPSVDGLQTLDVEAADLPGPGVYHYRLQADRLGMRTGKMLVW